jgi:hypothetical protein
MRNSVFMLLLALCACNSNMKENDVTASSPETNGDAQLSKVATAGQVLPDFDVHAKLIRTADYHFKVRDLKQSTAVIEQEIKKFPAYVSASNLTYQTNSITNEMTVRVQSQYFNALLAEIDKQAIYVHRRNIRTEDVGKQFVDLESRLKTKREVQERYKEILRTKAGKIEELLSAEEQIGDLQEEIEATVSRLNFLKEQVAYSTINLQFYQQLDEQLLAKEDDQFLARFGHAFNSGLEGALELILLLATLWPLIILAVIAFILYRRRLKALVTIRR